MDEAIVNAVAHRDYAVAIPIGCEKYTDALVVCSPGPVQQQHHVPDRFSLDTMRLDHMPHNRHLLDWLKPIKDAKGSPFVQALREGTRRMLSKMLALQLPAPEYTVGPILTEVVLYSNAPRREEEFAKAAASGRVEQTTERANLFALTSSALDLAQGNSDVQRRKVMHALVDRLKVAGWFIDTLRFGEIVAHFRGSEMGAPAAVAKIVRVYPACAFQVKIYMGRASLVVDPTVVIQSVLAVPSLLLEVAPKQLVGLHAYADCGPDVGGWQRVRLLQVASDLTRVQMFSHEREAVVPSGRVIPRLPREMIDVALHRAGVVFDLAREVKRALPSGTAGASRARAEHTRDLVVTLARDVFSLRVPGGDVALSLEPLPLAPRSDGSRTIRVEGLREPEVEFGGEHSGTDIRDGIGRHGSYGHERREIEIVPVCSPDQGDAMKALIQRLQAGKFKYRGAERTFSTRLTYRTITTASLAQAHPECERLLSEHPEWCGAAELPRIFLVHCPEADRSLDDETSPFYRYDVATATTPLFRGVGSSGYHPEP